jgi:hypothetical protein
MQSMKDAMGPDTPAERFASFMDHYFEKSGLPRLVEVLR